MVRLARPSSGTVLTSPEAPIFLLVVECYEDIALKSYHVLLFRQHQYLIILPRKLCHKHSRPSPFHRFTQGFTTAPFPNAQPHAEQGSFQSARCLRGFHINRLPQRCSNPRTASSISSRSGSPPVKFARSAISPCLSDSSLIPFDVEFPRFGICLPALSAS